MTTFVKKYVMGCDMYQWMKNCPQQPFGPLVMNIKWDYNYYQPWSDNEWLVDEMLAMLDEDIIMQ